MFNTIVAVVLSICAYLSLSLGQDWLSVGYGLNPWIAFPMTAMFLVGASAAAYSILLDHQNEVAQLDYDLFMSEARAMHQQQIIELSRKLS